MTTTTAEDGITAAVLAHVYSLHGGPVLPMPSKIVETIQKHLTVVASTRLRVTAFGADVLVVEVTGGQDVDGDGQPEVHVRLDAPGSQFDVEARVNLPASALKAGGDVLFAAALTALQAKVPTTAGLAKLVEALTGTGKP